MRGMDKNGQRESLSDGRGGSRMGANDMNRPTERVSADNLRERLNNDGQFVRVDRLGEVFRPRGVDRNWRPYSNGHWIFNDRVGWYFESDEPWAEITYHYGRWYDDPDQGWVWVAGTEWAPAWVEWRRGGGHVGWRPLPPDNAPKRVAGRGRGGSRTEVTETEEWVFVPTDRITAESITEVEVRPQRVTEIYRETRPLGRAQVRNGFAVNFALQPQVIEREANIRIRSQNLPRAEAAPVPAQVQSIATEQRSATRQSTSGQSTSGQSTSGKSTSGTSGGATSTEATGSTSTTDPTRNNAAAGRNNG